MPVITEEFLRRLEKQGKLNTLKVSEKDILTPSAREFLNSRNLNFEKEEVAVEEKVELVQAKAPVYKYKSYHDEAVYEKKPEYMTQIFGNYLVVKNHKRIILRGKFDNLQAQTVKYWKKYQKNKKLESDFSQAYRYVRDLFICEMTDAEFIERDVLGHDIDSLKDITHNTMKYFKTGHLFEINVEFGEDVIDINCLRALSRECELAAVEAFYHEGKVEHSDILKALNRLSSVFYLMMLKANNGDYK